MVRQSLERTKWVTELIWENIEKAFGTDAVFAPEHNQQKTQPGDSWLRFWKEKSSAGAESGSIRVAVVRLAVRVITRGAALALVALVLIILSVALILGIADGVAAEGTETSADGCTFKAATALVANDAADGSTAKSTDDGASLGVWTRGTRDKADGREE